MNRRPLGPKPSALATALHPALCKFMRSACQGQEKTSAHILTFGKFRVHSDQAEQEKTVRGEPVEPSPKPPSFPGRGPKLNLGDTPRPPSIPRYRDCNPLGRVQSRPVGTGGGTGVSPEIFFSPSPASGGRGRKEYFGGPGVTIPISRD